MVDKSKRTIFLHEYHHSIRYNFLIRTVFNQTKTQNWKRQSI